MLVKSLETPSDVIIYDLEDSVAPDTKPRARSALHEFLNVRRLMSSMRTIGLTVSLDTT